MSHSMPDVTLGESVYRLLTGGLSSAAERDFARMVGELGLGRTQRESAKFVGIDRRTWQRWLVRIAEGKDAPKGDALNVLRRALRRKRLALGRERRLTGPNGQRKWRLKGRIQVSSDVRPRTIKPGSVLSDDPDDPGYWTWHRVISLYLSGADVTILGQEANRAIQIYAPGMHVISVEWATA